ncbi:hypothetical protein ABIB90_000469 [Bradyrhizobium sp. JR4.1]
MRRSTLATAQNGGFISTTLGVKMIVDMRGVEAGDGDAGKERCKKSTAG